ncbi:sensor histidine kinase [Paenibacillus rigui]|uniref:histidine kinase n=1 Tax=Paenibacillus rigui TaxID=554312 RepID=A0A229UVU0_9BACL|nr:HAMP domain-containing sensor histidine kinase [Paenibacillus rigui]OXM87255.1 two-component sensor histidine kinase [Paenibacillus rigui]
MDIEPWLTEIKKRKTQYIEYWIEQFNDQFVDQYDHAALYKQGDTLFDFFVDLHIPAEEHSIQWLVDDWCRKYKEVNVHIIHIITGAHLWRKTFLEIESEVITIAQYRDISYRIDQFERVMCECYWNQAVSAMREKDQAIHALHDDRINLIGKMAASMAHEIRNPLTAIKGFLKLLSSSLRYPDPTKFQTYIGYIENECNNIHMQVTGFLSFSKRPIMEEEMAVLPIKPTLEYSLSLLNPRLINENVELTVSVPSGLFVKVQKLAFQQVLSNLINNGIDALSEIKYNKKMHISCFEDQETVHIHVSNNGPRIPEEISRTIFAPFVTNKADGTGLGLAICKQIMSKNNGDISFTSNEFATTFMLTFQKNASSAITNT